MDPLKNREILKRPKAFKRLMMRFLKESHLDNVTKNSLEGLFLEMYINYMAHEEKQYSEQQFIRDLTQVTLAISKLDGEIIDGETFLNKLNYSEREVDIHNLTSTRQADRALFRQIRAKWHTFTE